ncbi:hypothetical protein LguiA_028748 [Lonicera macranthoides]
MSISLSIECVSCPGIVYLTLKGGLESCGNMDLITSQNNLKVQATMVKVSFPLPRQKERRIKPSVRDKERHRESHGESKEVVVVVVVVEATPSRSLKESKEEEDFTHLTLKFTTCNASSKYDFVNVKVWLGDNADHYNELSYQTMSGAQYILGTVEFLNLGSNVKESVTIKITKEVVFEEPFKTIGISVL